MKHKIAAGTSINNICHVCDNALLTMSVTSVERTGGGSKFSTLKLQHSVQFAFHKKINPVKSSDPSFIDFSLGHHI